MYDACSYEKWGHQDTERLVELCLEKRLKTGCFKTFSNVDGSPVGKLIYASFFSPIPPYLFLCAP